MRTRPLLTGLLATSSLLAMTSVQAGIVSASGAALQITAPASIVANTGTENNATASVFNELQNVTLTGAVSVGARTPGFFDALADLTAGSIAAGTLVNSHYVHADPVGSGQTQYTYSGSITFDADILGVASVNAELVDTHFLGAPGTMYPNATNVNGIDYSELTDSFTISNDRRTLSFTFVAYAGADALRVITAGTRQAVPEPGAAGLVLAALGALALTRRRQAGKA